MLKTVVKSIHPFIRYTRLSLMGCWGSWSQSVGDTVRKTVVQPGQATTKSQGWYMERDDHSHSHSHRWPFYSRQLTCLGIYRVTVCDLAQIHQSQEVWKDHCCFSKTSLKNT